MAQTSTPQQAPSGLALTPSQIMSLPAQQQAAYLAGMSPQNQQLYQAELINLQNANFMRGSQERIVQCPVDGGSGQTATYTAGQTINFDLPTVPGYARALIIRYNLAVTPAAGTGATYQLTAAQRWAIFSRLYLNYSNPQINTHPYFLKVVDMAQGRMTGPQNTVLAGQADSALDAVIVGGTPLVVGSANTWEGYMVVRLNAINDESPFGLLPLNGVGNNPQLQITCAPNLYGADPLQNAICAGATGTGQAVTVTGTIAVDCIVLDGKNLASINPYQLEGVIGMPTMQYGWETNLSPLNSGTQNTFVIKTKMEHWLAAALVIDGRQSTSFISGLSNLTSFTLGSNSTDADLINIAQSNNIPIYEWFNRQRNMLKQDLDEGVILWGAAATRGRVDASQRNGMQVMNCYPDGYPGMAHGYNVGVVGSVCTARIELFLLSKNRQGIQVASS